MGWGSGCSPGWPRRPQGSSSGRWTPPSPPARSAPRPSPWRRPRPSRRAPRCSRLGPRRGQWSSGAVRTSSATSSSARFTRWRPGRAGVPQGRRVRCRRRPAGCPGRRLRRPPPLSSLSPGSVNPDPARVSRGIRVNLPVRETVSASRPSGDLARQDCLRPHAGPYLCGTDDGSEARSGRGRARRCPATPDS